MATADVIPAASHALSDEQVEQMLARAAARLRDRAQQVAKKPSAESSFNFPKLDPGKLVTTVAADQVDARNVPAVRKVEDPITAAHAKKEKQKATAGANWYNMPRTNLTPELKRDLQLLKMRSVLDPHRQYKKENGKMQAPEYSQVGTIVEGATEYFTGRLDNKQRKRTFVEEVLAGEHETKRFKRQYGELQQKTTSGKKAFYKDLKAKRKGGIKK